MPDSTPTTSFELLERGDASRPAITAPGGPTITYESLRAQVEALAGQLRALGIQRGDRVVIVLPNGVESIVSFLAVSAVATAAPLNAAYKADEMRFYMEDTGLRALITVPGVGDVARSQAPDSTILIEVSNGPGGDVSFSPAGGDTAGFEPPSPDDVALVLYTSGTTSRPKRVPLRHRNLAVSASNIVASYSLGPEDVSLCVMPLFHVHGLMASALSTLLSGGTVVVPPRFNPLNFWPVVREHSVTWSTAVPTMHQALLARAGREKGGGARPHDTLRFLRSCSAPLGREAMLEMEDRFQVPVVEAYGMTEASHQMTSNPLPPRRRLPGSVGPGTGVSVGIMDETGRLLPIGERGEIVVKGPNVIDGYESNPEANASSFTDGWFRTGDEGTLDSDGYLELTGRLKEMINRSGEKISPWEIDEVFSAHPAVAEAVSFGMPHATHGEEPQVAVVLQAEASKAELISFCKERLADFKVPRVIHIVDEIPRTATGKVQRRIVAQKVMETGE